MKILIAALLLVVSMSSSANAYIDPVGLSYLLQILAAIGAGAVLMIRQVRTFFSNIFLKIRGKTKP